MSFLRGAFSTLPSLTAPASEDWCESNYVVSPAIAEFWNTISSLRIIATGIVGLLVGLRQNYRRRFLVPSVMLVFVGLGSTLFHATLTYWGQALDELTMCVCKRPPLARSRAQTSATSCSPAHTGASLFFAHNFLTPGTPFTPPSTPIFLSLIHI